MAITLYSLGAAEEVTGSKHVLEVDGRSYLIDCGAFQGKRAEADRKNREFGIDTDRIESVVLTHGHFDHCGLLPLLQKRGYKGTIYTTPATRDIEEYQRIFKLASILLQYPDAEWIRDADADLRREVAGLENRSVQELFQQFLGFLDDAGAEQLAEHYVNLFDFSDKTTMYLTYLVFGDNQERGAAFLKLKEEFANAGYPLEDDELPDFLPVVLEFAAIAAEEHACKVLMIHKRAIDRLAAELEAADSPYRWVLQGCVRAVESLLAEKKAS